MNCKKHVIWLICALFILCACSEPNQTVSATHSTDTYLSASLIQVSESVTVSQEEYIGKSDVPQKTEYDISNFKAVTVKRVVDGDTFIYKENNSEIRVRIIGVNAPESVHPNEEKNTPEGKEASEYTKSLIEGKTVYLEYDLDLYDDYERELAYVYLEDGQMLQDILLTEGYATIMTIQPNVKYADHFYEIQKEARENKKGFWNGFFY